MAQLPGTIRYGRSLAGALAMLLTTGCETARMPLEVNPTGAPAPLRHSTLVGEPARLAWIAGLSGELQAVDDVIGAGAATDSALTVRAGRLRDQVYDANSTADSTDEDAGIIKFGTQIDISTNGPGWVMAFTETSRATHIEHTIRITETSEGRTYAHPAVTDDSGWMNQRSLLTSIDLDTCTRQMTLEARTHHEAGSLTFRHRQALSDADASCNPPSPCPSDKESPISYSCTGSGGNGETTTMTCYTVTTEYYWYYPDTDTYEYRYSETSTWCESSS